MAPARTRGFWEKTGCVAASTNLERRSPLHDVRAERELVWNRGAGRAYADLSGIGLQVDSHDVDNGNRYAARDLQGRHYGVEPLIAQMTIEICLGNRPKSQGVTDTGDRFSPGRVSALSVE